MRKVQPASLEEIKAQIDGSYAFAAGAEDKQYGRARGIRQILTVGQDYAELPGFGGRSARDIITALPKGSRMLDVGCGYGQLGAEIAESLNPGVEVYGFDAQAQPGQERLAKVALGSVDNLSPDTFGGARFDLIVSSALLYHLPDHWGALLRMSRLLCVGGILLASTIPRVIRAIGEPMDNAQGLLTEADSGIFFYYRHRNVLDVGEKLVPSGELVELLNTTNAHFKLQYGLASAAHISGVNNVGGQISGRRLSAEGSLALSDMFYCFLEGRLGYVVARTGEERAQLAASGFVNLHDRL